MSARRRRKRLWEIPSGYHCSVLGTCATLDDLRRICRRAGVTVSGEISDYELHRYFVGIAEEPVPPIKMLDKTLGRRFATAQQRFARAHDAQALLSHWAEHRDAGEVAAAYWAIMTHPAATAGLREAIHGQVHMMSHRAGATQRADLRRLQHLKDRAARLEQLVGRLRAQSARRLARRDARIRELESQAEDGRIARRRLSDAEARLEAHESSHLTRGLRDRIASLEAELARATSRAERAERDAEQWANLARRAGDRNIQLESELADTRAERDEWAQAYRDALAGAGRRMPDLARRRVLYVGGRNGLVGHFREVVERHNGTLLHHDGGIEDRSTRISGLVSQADAVLCPLDCVSHEACTRLRRLCRRHMKPLVTVRSAGLSAFTQGLDEIAGLLRSPTAEASS